MTCFGQPGELSHAIKNTPPLLHVKMCMHLILCTMFCYPYKKLCVGQMGQTIHTLYYCVFLIMVVSDMYIHNKNTFLIAQKQVQMAIPAIKKVLHISSDLDLTRSETTHLEEVCC